MCICCGRWASAGLHFENEHGVDLGRKRAFARSLRGDIATGGEKSPACLDGEYRRMEMRSECGCGGAASVLAWTCGGMSQPFDASMAAAEAGRPAESMRSDDGRFHSSILKTRRAMPWFRRRVPSAHLCQESSVRIVGFTFRMCRERQGERRHIHLLHRGRSVSPPMSSILKRTECHCPTESTKRPSE